MNGKQSSAASCPEGKEELAQLSDTASNSDDKSGDKDDDDSSSSAAQKEDGSVLPNGENEVTHPLRDSVGEGVASGDALVQEVVDGETRGESENFAGAETVGTTADSSDGLGDNSQNEATSKKSNPLLDEDEDEEHENANNKSDDSSFEKLKQLPDTEDEGIQPPTGVTDVETMSMEHEDSETVLNDDPGSICNESFSGIPIAKIDEDMAAARGDGIPTEVQKRKTAFARNSSYSESPLAKIDEQVMETHDDNILRETRNRMMAIVHNSFGSGSTSCPPAPLLSRGDRYRAPGAVAIRRGTLEHELSEELPAEYSAEFHSGSKRSIQPEFGAIATLAPDHEEEVEELVQRRLQERTSGSSEIMNTSSQGIRTASAEIVYAEPTSVDRIIDDPDEEGHFLKQKAVQLSLFAILIVFGAVGIFLGIFLSRSSSEDSPISATASPTAAPTNVLLRERLSNGIVQSTRDIQGGAQLQALRWMETEDEYTAMNLENMQDTELAERYAAAVFLFSMANDDISKTSLRFLMPNLATCEWTSVTTNAQSKGFACEDNSVTQLLFETVGLAGALPEEIFLFESLRRIALWENLIFGSIPARIGDLSLLEHLRIGRNQITGSIPDSLTTLTNLITLQLTTNKLTGTIPRAIADLSNLTELTLSINQLTGTVPEAVGSLTNLEAIRFFNNYGLGGSMPPGIWAMSKLQRIDAFSCQFTGTIPTTIGGLTKASDLGLFNNSMTGTLPTEVGLMTSLVWLRVNDNAFQGTIPTELGELERMFRITIQNTNIGGSLPSELGKLTDLHYLDVSNSSLTGEIPSEFAAITDLQVFIFHSTNLTGSIDSIFCGEGNDDGFTTLAASYCKGGENEQPPSVECSCCNSCCDEDMCYRYR